MISISPSGTTTSSRVLSTCTCRGQGTDTLDGGAAISTMAERLPRFGVTAFCPTSIACEPLALRNMLAGVRIARTTRPPGGARVLPAHLESNFINPEYKGAQPAACLRLPPQAAARRSADRQPSPSAPARKPRGGRVRADDSRRDRRPARSACHDRAGARGAIDLSAMGRARHSVARSFRRDL